MGEIAGEEQERGGKGSKDKREEEKGEDIFQVPFGFDAGIDRQKNDKLAGIIEKPENVADTGEWGRGVCKNIVIGPNELGDGKRGKGNDPQR